MDTRPRSAQPVAIRVGESMVRVEPATFCTAAVQATSAPAARANAACTGIIMPLDAVLLPVRKPLKAPNSGAR